MIQTRWTWACILYFSWLHLHCSASTSEDFFLRLKREANFVEAENANEIFDDFFVENKPLMYDSGLDPLNLGTIDVCSDCVLTGLSTIHRTQGQNSTVKNELNGDKVVDVVVGFTRLDGRCSCTKQIFWSYVKGDASLEIHDLDVRLVVRVKVSPDADVPTRTSLDHFEVKRLGKLSFGWNGIGVLGTVFEWVVDLFRWKVEQIGRDIMPGIIRSFVVQMLEELAAKSKQI